MRSNAAKCSREVTRRNQTAKKPAVCKNGRLFRAWRANMQIGNGNDVWFDISVYIGGTFTIPVLPDSKKMSVMTA
jgi:hypothetical protein